MKAIEEYQQNDNEMDAVRDQLQEQTRKNKKLIRKNAELKMQLNTISNVKEEENKETEQELQELKQKHLKIKKQLKEKTDLERGHRFNAGKMFLKALD